jgi:predicted kinase
LKNNLLNILAKVDNLGRICKNQEDQIHTCEMTALHKLFCEENDCFDGRKAFQSDRARFRYLFERRGHPNIDWLEKINGEVIMMSGIQGSGKSYIIDKDYKHLPIVGSDETRIDLDMEYGEDEGTILRSVKEQCKVLMREKRDFVFNATCTIKDIRGKWIRLFRDYGYNITIHYVERPLDVTLKANKSREKSVPECVIYEKFAKLDVPTLLECHKLILSV